RYPPRSARRPHRAPRGRVARSRRSGHWNDGSRRSDHRRPHRGLRSDRGVTHRSCGACRSRARDGRDDDRDRGSPRPRVGTTWPPLVIVPITAVARRWLLTTPVAGLVRGVALATAGLLAATGISIVTATGTPSWWQLALAAAGVVLTYRGTVHPAIVIAIGAA